MPDAQRANDAGKHGRAYLLTRGLLPQMIARKRGGILNVSSSAGFLPIPGIRCLRGDQSVRDQLLRSASRRTSWHRRERLALSVPALCIQNFKKSRTAPVGSPTVAPEFVHVSVEQVVRDALAALEADRPLVIPGFAMKLGMFLVRLTPMPIFAMGFAVSEKRN